MTAIAHVAPIAASAFAPIRARLTALIARVGAIIRQLGPYAVVEILLPGGTLMELDTTTFRSSSDAPPASVGATVREQPKGTGKATLGEGACATKRISVVSSVAQG